MICIWILRRDTRDDEYSWYTIGHSQSEPWNAIIKGIIKKKKKVFDQMALYK